MPKTSLDVITEAYENLGVAAEDVPLTAEQQAIGKRKLDALFAEFVAEGFTTLTDVEAVPDVAFLGVAQMLEVELSGNRYGIPRNSQDWRMGLRRLRRLLMPDNRVDQSDLDEDGTVTEDESDAYDRAQYY